MSQVPVNANFSPMSGPFTPSSSDMYPGEPIYTEVAKSFINIMGRTPLTDIFPEETIRERLVIIEVEHEAYPSLMPLVDWNKPDVITGSNPNRMSRRPIQPLVVRESKFISHAELNTRLRPGSMNEFWNPEEQIAEIIRKMVESHNLTFDVYRGMMLMGGINLSDPRTGTSVAVSAQIPRHNIWEYTVTEGYRARNESSLFLKIHDANDVNPLSQGTPWTDPNSDILSMVQRFTNWFRQTNKSRVTAMYMSADLAHIISFNNQVKLFAGGTLFNVPPMGATISRQGPEPFVGLTPMGFGMGPEGVTSIAGIPVRVVDTKYRDPGSGRLKGVFPSNKVVFVSEVDANGRAEAPGRTQFCVSENKGGAPGLWTRMVEELPPPSPPGKLIQMGNAGLPYLKFPFRVAQVVVASPEDIHKRLGVVGDLSYGQV